ncbi:aspartyl-tRNA(Asn)/glutamyl-tRNA(Gln) amidotransferase subunit A [Devosia sp. YR412]|uniref:amidase n=1 Tax=Devosia sp. YR412 TaxID=1881030 RepID=UPI0008C55D5A|nr:amidase [Devosia sp. YR412]SEP64998.1 aspartyl-tRNA(Asn)/glutamyl-tRNA(Gln) amidotransferase subunit A [Devosia sp. YR412]
MAIDPSEQASRDAFAASVARHGLTMNAAEAEGVYQLASWMSDGIAGLQVGPTTTDIADAALDLSLFEQGKRMRDGRLTSVALVEACLRRIEARDPSYRAFYAIDREPALTAARQADAEFAAGLDHGPLQGIPVGIKDLIHVAGLATTANTPGRKAAIATADADVVQRLRAAGAIIIGKLATYEWGTVGPDSRGAFPPARNPWSLEHITGGSSSGSAVAVAGGLLRTTLGTDTGGSLRGPAFYCGVVGLKPTFGLVPRDGVLPMSDSMDHVGPMSATVAEAALTLDLIAGLAAEKSATRLLGQSIAGKRIGYARNWFAQDHQTMPAVLTAMDAAISTLSQLGAVIEEVDLPDYPAIEVAAAAILHKESFDYHLPELRDHPEHFGRRAYLSLAAGLAVTDEELAAARGAGDCFRAEVDRLLDRYDAIITVGALTTALLAAPFEKEAVWTPMRTIGFNVSGHPVLALPIGFHDGLPIGMQIIGRHHDEARIIQIGDAFERATDHAVQRPPQLT